MIRVWARTGLVMGTLLVGCSGGGSSAGLREWQPSDHQPPPATPSGQGAGDPVATKKAAAAALWNMRCATCHGPGGRGDGAGRPPGAALPDFTAKTFHEGRSDEQLAQAVAKGRGLMPAFDSQLSAQGIAAIVEHVRGLRAP